MSDIIVTLPKTFTWDGAPGLPALEAWLAEGDRPGDPPSGNEYAFTVSGKKPDILPTERVYLCHHGSLIGYAPLIRVEGDYTGRDFGKWRLIRGGGAVACTIPEDIRGFQGWRRRWWPRELEAPLDLESFIMRLREEGGQR